MYIMNIFVLDQDPTQAAQLQCDKHVVKMIVESAQMLSTAHRVLDGILTKRPSKSGKTIVKYYELDDYEAELIYYKAVHINHPCSIWCRESEANYRWLWDHMFALCQEYTHRYGKMHKSESVLWPLRSSPLNIPKGGLTAFKLAMQSNPECINKSDPIKSYRMFYQTKQSRFKMAWTKRNIPEWFEVMNANV
jgi:hypothetical protein